jgi:hypothetical protein
MIKRAVAVAVTLVGICFPLAAQQPNRTEGTKRFEQSNGSNIFDNTFDLSLYEPKIFRARDDSLLLRKSRLLPWADGSQLVSERALAALGFGSLDLFPAAYLAPTNYAPAPARKASIAPRPPTGNFESDGKDLSDEMIDSPLNRVYYWGEVGFLYGHWSGKGNGDLIDTYILGQVGNDHFQITAGAEYEQWSGRTTRFRSFGVGAR